MSNVIRFPGLDERNKKELEELLSNEIQLPFNVDRERWKKVAVPQLVSLLKLPSFQRSFTIKDSNDEQENSFENQLTTAFQEYGFEVLKPLIIEIAKLHIELLKKS